MKYHIFLQARINSKRFPRKVLKKIFGKSIIELLVERLHRINERVKIILVTGEKEKNYPLIEIAEKLKIDYFCGSEENILDRLYQASMKFKSHNIIRITADNPLIDINLIKEGIEKFSKHEYDILNVDTVDGGYPQGMNFEIFSSDALKRTRNEIFKKYSKKEDFDQTFISPAINMLKNKKFKKYSLKTKNNFSLLRLTMDNQEDFELIKILYKKFYQKEELFGLNEVLELYKQNPKIFSIHNYL